MHNPTAEHDDFDSLVAGISRTVTADQVQEAKRVSQFLADSPAAFGPVVMFALDKA
jgi:hypothetical protein